MKKSIITILALAAVSCIILGFTQSKEHKTARTEEYAIVEVQQYGLKLLINITIGENPTERVVWEREKTDRVGEFSPVIKELDKLNMQGFELLNVSSLAYNTTPVHTFMLRKKL